MLLRPVGLCENKPKGHKKLSVDGARLVSLYPFVFSLQLHATQLRGEPLGSPLTPGSAAARRTTPTEAQPVTVPAPPVVESPFSPASPVSATPTAPASSGDAASPPDPEAGTSSDATAMATISADEDETPDISEKLKKWVYKKKICNLLLAGLHNFTILG